MNYFYKKTKLMAIISLLAISTSLLSGFGYYDGLGQVVYNAETYISPNAFYEEKISVNSNQAVIHSFSTDMSGIDSNVTPYAFVGDIVGRASLTYMKNLLKAEGLTVIAGINGDYFDTVTGVPLGMSIHEGKLKNTGLNYSNAIGFKSDGTAFVGKVVFDYTFTVNGNDTYSFQHINKPRGASNSLHLFNSNYASSTRTSGSNTEVVMTALDSTEPFINGTINAQVESVNINTSNTSIGDNNLVFSASSGTPYAATLETLAPGDNIAITTTDLTGEFADTVEAMGAYEIIVQNGAISTDSTDTNPRTCIGIKPDGSIIIYAVDGRSPGHSVGMNLKDVASYLISRGCTSAVNMDGGGSTTMLVRMPGDAEATLMNLPSDGKERNVSNALFFVTKTATGDTTSNLHLYPLTTLIMPGANIGFITKSTDEKYFPTEPPRNLTYSIDGDIGVIDENGVFTANKVGDGKITVEGDGMATTSIVQVTDKISINPDKTNILIDPGKTIDINVKAYSSYVPVLTNDNLFSWSCDKAIGTIDQNGVFTASSNPGLKGNIYISYGDKKSTIPVQIAGTRISFSDTNDHWAKDYIEVLAGSGIVNGMGDNMFQPDAQLTKAQFLTMLSKLVPNNDVSSFPNSGFTDVVPTEWYVPYVNWGYANKIISGNPDNTFAPNAPITREQMTMILNNFSKVQGVELLPKVDDYSFTDQATISAWANNAVDTIVKAGIMKGRPEGNFDPQGFASRAEASIVTYSIMNLME
ncbi:MAG: S-layer homology domain-containing protein [Eubacteriales bacterium]